MSNTLILSGAIKVGSLASDPINPANGLIYYNTVSNTFRKYENGGWTALAPASGANTTLSNLTSPTSINQHLLPDADVTRNLGASGSQFSDLWISNINSSSDMTIESAAGSALTLQGGSDIGVLADSVSIQSLAGSVDIATTNGSMSLTVPAGETINFLRTGSPPVVGQVWTATSTVGAGYWATPTTDASGLTYTPAVLTDWDGNADPGNIDDALDQLAERVDDNEATIALKADQTVVTEIDDNVDDLISLSGVAENATDLGTFTGSTIADNSTVKTALQALETEVETKLDASQKGAANGVAELDGAGKVPASQLPSAVMTYEGVWNASTNSPTLADGAGDAGQVYRVGTAGTQNLGSGAIAFDVGDYVIYNGTVWEKSDTTDAVASVNGQTGVVVLDADDIDDAATTNKFATAAQLTKVDFITVTQAVNLDSVESLANSALQSGDNISELVNDQGYITGVQDDTAPELGGNLTLGTNVLIHNTDGMKRGTSASDFLEEEYIHSIALSGSQTNTVIAALTFAHATYEGMEVTYKVKESTSNDIKIGTLRIVTNGTAVVLNDMSTETADTGISFSAAVNGANIEIRYSSGANGATMRCDVKRIKA